LTTMRTKKTKKMTMSDEDVPSPLASNGAYPAI
jgi:hypothetical protein